MNSLEALQALVTETLAEADRTRSAKLLMATRELDLIVDRLATGGVTRKELVNATQVVVIQAGLVDASTEFRFAPVVKAIAATL